MDFLLESLIGSIVEKYRLVEEHQCLPIYGVLSPYLEPETKGFLTIRSLYYTGYLRSSSLYQFDSLAA